MAGAAVYEALHSVEPTLNNEEEVRRHNDRVRRSGVIMDKLLDTLEAWM